MEQPKNKIHLSSLAPWRVLVACLGVVLCGALVYIHVLNVTKNSIETFHKEFPLIDISRYFVQKEHFLINIDPLRTAVRAYVRETIDLKASVYIEFLNTGANISVNPEYRFWPASLTKLPVAMAAMSAVEKGLWTLDHTFVLKESDKTTISSKLHAYPTGTEFTLEALLAILLLHSDNTAYRILTRSLPESELEEMRDALGLEYLIDDEGKMSAKEYSRFFRALYVAGYLTPEHAHYILTLLDKSEFREFLRTAVPDDVPFPHKFGILPETHTYNDSGIVYIPDKPYLITVTVEGTGKPHEQERVQEFMDAISSMTYVFFSQTK